MHHPTFVLRPAARACALAVATLLAACSASEGLPDGGRDARADGTVGPDGSNGCEPGRIYCQANQPYECDRAGRRINLPACEGARPACVAGTGCAVCDPNARRCNPDDPDVPQTCLPDGSSWVDAARCVAAEGRECVGGVCVDPCAQAAEQRSYLGCEYWPVSLGNARSVSAEGGGGFPFPFAIVIANPQTRPVTAYINGGALSSMITRTIAPGALETVELPWVMPIVQSQTSVLARGGAYHVRTTAPVTVYQFNPLTFQSGGSFSFSNDASLLLPTTVLTRRYTNLTYPDWNYMGTRFGSYVAVVGVGSGESPTQVTVRLSGAIASGPGVTGGAAGSTQTYMLGRGDVLELMGSGSGDMTGTVVEASEPVAVFGGHFATQVPNGRVAADHLEEQMLPEETWGRRYAVTGLVDRPGVPSLVRIMALRDGTRLTFDPPSVHAGVIVGSRRVLELQTTEDFVVTASEPVLVAQFMPGQGSNTSGNGDPAMVLEVPIEQFRSHYTFLTPSTYTRSFVNIVGDTGATPVLDGAPVTVAPRAIGSSGQSVWSVELRPGTHRIGMPDASSRYGIKVYGVAPYTSYAFPGGMDLELINPG